MFDVVLSPQGERVSSQGSVSEEATREPEPVLPSRGPEAVFPVYVPFSVGSWDWRWGEVLEGNVPRDLGLSLKLEPMGELFHMLLVPGQPGVGPKPCARVD